MLGMLWIYLQRLVEGVAEHIVDLLFDGSESCRHYCLFANGGKKRRN